MVLILFIQSLMQVSFATYVSFDPVILQPLPTNPDLNWFSSTHCEPNQNIDFEVVRLTGG